MSFFHLSSLSFRVLKDFLWRFIVIARMSDRQKVPVSTLNALPLNSGDAAGGKTPQVAESSKHHASASDSFEQRFKLMEDRIMSSLVEKLQQFAIATLPKPTPIEQSPSDAKTAKKKKKKKANQRKSQLEAAEKKAPDHVTAAVPRVSTAALKAALSEPADVIEDASDVEDEGSAGGDSHGVRSTRGRRAAIIASVWRGPASLMPCMWKVPTTETSRWQSLCAASPVFSWLTVSVIGQCATSW
ncbi:MAG TPA: hypothetical protein V6C97_17065, partial [Oculatellaceae cyanobacterium]